MATGMAVVITISQVTRIALQKGQEELLLEQQTTMDNPNEAYPNAFPCVLIEMLEIG